MIFMILLSKHSQGVILHEQVHILCIITHHIGGFGKTDSNPARCLANKVEVKEGGVPLVGVNPHEEVTVVRVTAAGLSVAQTIVTGIAGLEKERGWE